MSTIKPWGIYSANKELRTVGSRTGVGHGEDALSFVLQFEVFVLKLVTVD
jgi:hypothetical protein